MCKSFVPYKEKEVLAITKREKIVKIWQVSIPCIACFLEFLVYEKTKKGCSGVARGGQKGHLPPIFFGIVDKTC